MALTATQSKSMYQFFALAFNSAPGVTYMDQLDAAINSGMSVTEVVEQFTTKAEFTSTYPNFLSNEAFATKFITNNVGSNASAAAIAEAIADVTAALNAGWSRGKTITQVFTNITNLSETDATWGNVVKSVNNKVAYAQYYTETLLGGAEATPNLAALRAVIANVTPTTSVAVADMAAVLNPAPVPVAQTFTLTTGTDNIVGGAGNDTITATNSTITGLDNIDGGAGNDTLTISDVDAAAVLSFLTVKNVETLNLISTGGLKASTDVSGWTGLTAANVTLQGVAADQTLTVANGSALNLTAKVTKASDITLGGGKTVAATVTNSVDNSGKTVTVNGDASTTTVTLTQVGKAAEAAGVAINDLNNGVAGKANTITTVTIDGLAGGTAAVKSDALATLNLANSAKDVTVTNGTSKHTLAVNLNKVTGGTINDAAATTLNVTTNGASSGLTLDAAETTTINFAGAAALSATVTAAKLTTVTIDGAGGVTADLSGKTVTSVSAANSTGANTITLEATKATFVGGSGVDTLILAAAPSKAVDGGAGTDILSMASVTDLGTLTSKALANATNFEVLGLTGAFGTNGDAAKSTLDLSAVTGFTGVQIDSTTVTNDLVLSNASATTALTLLQVTGTKTTVNLKTDGASDALSLTLGNAKSAALDFSGKDITASGQDTVTVAANADTSAAAVQHKVVLALDAAATLNVSGAAGVDFTGSTFTKLATVNSTSAGNVKIALSVDVATSVTTGAGDDTIETASNAGTKAATINTGDGDNSVTTYAGNDVITTGKGDDTINAGEGNNTVSAGDGKNDVTVANGNNTITTGAGADTISVGNGTNTINAGAGDDTVTVGSGANTVTLGAGADTLKIGATNTSSSTFTTVTDLEKGDIITLNNVVANATGTLGAALTSGVNDYQTFLAAAAAKGNGVVSWFQFGGDTYLVQDNTAGSNSFLDGADLIVKITGAVDLSTSTLTNAAAILTVA